MNPSLPPRRSSRPASSPAPDRAELLRNFAEEDREVHLEKARRNLKGLYQMKHRETPKMIDAAGYRLINREEDLGKDGLRQAKLSYHPLEIYPVCNLTFDAGQSAGVGVSHL